MYKQIEKKVLALKKECLEEQKYLNDDHAKKWLSYYQYKSWEKGILSKKDAQSIIDKKIDKRIAKIEVENTNYFDTLRKYAKFKIDYVRVSVEWRKACYGTTNPTAEVTIGYYEGSIFKYDRTEYVMRGFSCGYDKETTAIAECFNRMPILINLAIQSDKKKLDEYAINHYGDNPLPSFSGGVGISPYHKFFEDMGFELTHSWGKMYDVYIYKKLKSKKK